MELMLKENKKHVIVTVLLILGALFSCLVAAKYAESPQYHKTAIESLDQKKADVTLLTAAAATTSTLITMSPDDIATPIAEQIAELSSCFLIILCALYLEKYLLTLTGYLTFRILIPLALILLAVHINRNRDRLKNFAVKLIIFGLAIYAVVPLSVKISTLIEDTYQSTISATLENAKQSAIEIQESAEGLSEEDEEGFWEGIKNKVSGGITGTVQKVKNMLNNFMDAAAVMLVTSCIIPVLVLVFLMWFVKAIWGMTIAIPQLSVKSGKTPEKEGSQAQNDKSEMKRIE